MCRARRVCSWRLYTLLPFHGHDRLVCRLLSEQAQAESPDAPHQPWSTTPLSTRLLREAPAACGTLLAYRHRDTTHPVCLSVKAAFISWGRSPSLVASWAACSSCVLTEPVPLAATSQHVYLSESLDRNPIGFLSCLNNGGRSVISVVDRSRTLQKRRARLPPPYSFATSCFGVVVTLSSMYLCPSLSSTFRQRSRQHLDCLPVSPAHLQTIPTAALGHPPLRPCLSERDRRDYCIVTTSKRIQGATSLPTSPLYTRSDWQGTLRPAPRPQR